MSAADFKIMFGKKYYGRSLGEIPQGELQSYVDWLKMSTARDGANQLHYAKDLFEKYDEFKNETIKRNQQ